MSTSTRLTRAAAAVAVALFALAGTAASAGPPAPPPAANTPAPKILVIDKTAILSSSKVEQDINRQGQAYMAAMQHDLKPEADGLQKDYQTLQQQVAILAPDVRAKKERDFQNRRAALQQKAFKRQAQVQYSVYLARQEVAKQLDPILTAIMNERGANLLLDRAAVLKGTQGSLDITKVAIDRLNQKMPTYKLQLTDPPPDILRQMMQQAAQQ
jgi:Skp family chaperone for outer membrane proteins